MAVAATATSADPVLERSRVAVSKEDDKRLVPPEGWTPVSSQKDGASEAPDASERRARPSDDFRLGLAWCIAGGAVSGFIPLLAGFACSYGTCLCCAGRGRKASLGAIAATVAASVVAGILAASGSVSEAVLPALAGSVVGLLVTRKHLSANALVLVALGITAGLIGTDAYISAQAGMSLAESESAFYQELADAYAASVGSAEAQGAAQAIVGLMETYWPLAYGIISVCYCLSAWLGAALFTRPGTPGVTYAVSFRDFDAPLWVLIVLVAGFVVDVMQREGIALPQELVFVAANLLQAMRFIAVLQGIALIVWFLAEHGVGSFGQVLGAFAGVLLEISFLVLSVFGLVDGFANFRNLRRKGIRSYQYRTDESK